MQYFPSRCCPYSAATSVATIIECHHWSRNVITFFVATIAGNNVCTIIPAVAHSLKFPDYTLMPLAYCKNEVILAMQCLVLYGKMFNAMGSEKEIKFT